MNNIPELAACLALRFYDEAEAPDPRDIEGLLHATAMHDIQALRDLCALYEVKNADLQLTA